jgi:hypothetical protein
MARNHAKHTKHKAKEIRLDAPTTNPVGPEDDFEEHAPSEAILKPHKPTKKHVRAMRSEE